MTPTGRKPKSLSAQVLHMSVDTGNQSVDLLIRIQRTELADRNLLHQAMKRGERVLLVYLAGEEEPPLEG